jgi:hypothetical protein
MLKLQITAVFFAQFLQRNSLRFLSLFIQDKWAERDFRCTVFPSTTFLFHCSVDPVMSQMFETCVFLPRVALGRVSYLDGKLVGADHQAVNLYSSHPHRTLLQTQVPRTIVYRLRMVFSGQLVRQERRQYMPLRRE